jgi:hypothetical protein
MPQHVFIYLEHPPSPQTVAGWIAALLLILEVPDWGNDPETGHAEISTWFSSVPACKYRVRSLNQVTPTSIRVLSDPLFTGLPIIPQSDLLTALFQFLLFFTYECLFIYIFFFYSRLFSQPIAWHSCFERGYPGSKYRPGCRLLWDFRHFPQFLRTDSRIWTKLGYDCFRLTSFPLEWPLLIILIDITESNVSRIYLSLLLPLGE